MSRRLYIALTMAFAVCTVQAQQPTSEVEVLPRERHTDSLDEKSWTVGVGAVNLLDTYLSQEKYRGTEVTFISQRLANWRRHRQWWWKTTNISSVPYASPRADNSDYLGLQYAYNLALLRQWKVGSRWRLWAGPQLEAAAGFLYSTRNTNNPAQVHAGLSIGASAMADYRLPFTIFGKHISARYEISLPLLGLVFSPNYGQSYYEIFTRGNYDHNIVPTTPFCAPSLRHQLSFDIALRRSSLRIGYLGDIQQTDVNALKYHSYGHMLIVGIRQPLYRQ